MPSPSYTFPDSLEHPATTIKRDAVKPVWGGDLFTTGHAWRNDEPFGEEPDWYCKWCGKKITGSAFAEEERCPGK